MAKIMIKNLLSTVIDKLFEDIEEIKLESNKEDNLFIDFAF